MASLTTNPSFGLDPFTHDWTMLPTGNASQTLPTVSLTTTGVLPAGPTLLLALAQVAVEASQAAVAWCASWVWFAVMVPKFWS